MMKKQGDSILLFSFRFFGFYGIITQHNESHEKENLKDACLTVWTAYN